MTLTTDNEARPLGGDTISAVIVHVEAAKARGWLQPDLRRYFAGKGVEFATYKAALSGEAIPLPIIHALGAISITGLPEQPARQAEDPFPDLPDNMKAAERWMVWRSEPNEDPAKKPRKVPYYATGQRRQGVLDSAEDLSQLVTYAEACAALTVGQFTGLGFALGPDAIGQCWQGIDLDNLDQHPGLQFVVEDLPGYTERSPSGGGVHAIGYGRAFVSLGSNTTGIEAYARGRFFTVTGESTGLGEIACLADFVEGRLAPLHSQRPQDTSAAVESGGGSIAGAFAAHDLRSALTAMRSDDRDTWIRMGHALKGLGNQGRALWLEWSQTSDKYDPADAARTWDSFRPERTGYQAVFAEAQRHGWANPASREAREEAEQVETQRVEEEVTRQAGTICASPYVWIDAARIPPRDILYGRHLFRQFLSATVAPGGLGKSSLVMVEALAMVTGQTLLGEVPKGELSVWYWNGEDPKEELQRRIAAACLFYRLTPDDLGGRLFLDSGRDTEIIIAREDRHGLHIAEPVVSAIVEEVKRNGIDVLIVDPFVACHAVSENDNMKIEGVVRQWMRVAEEGGCAVELVHHVRKPGGGQSQETTVDDARGAGALLAKARSARVLNAMSPTEADELGIEQKHRFGFFRVDNGKANLMPRGGEAHWRRMIGVPLGNRIDVLEDEVGVVTEWAKPSALDGITAADLHRVKMAVADGRWREDVRASNWVGHAIGSCLGIDADAPQGRARIRAMLKIWLKSKALEVVQELDESRRFRQFVIVGKGSE